MKKNMNQMMMTSDPEYVHDMRKGRKESRETKGERARRNGRRKKGSW